MNDVIKTEKIDKIVVSMAEEREKALVNFLVNDEKFQEFVKENYVLVTMEDLEMENGTAKVKEVVYPMRMEEWDRIKDKPEFKKYLADLMKEKMEEG